MLARGTEKMELNLLLAVSAFVTAFVALVLTIVSLAADYWLVAKEVGYK